MNNSENYSNPKPSGAPDQELLRELMPQLGMEATEPKKRYKAQARLRYLLPKVLTVCVVAALAVFAWFYLQSPSEFYNVTVTEGPESATVAFDVDRVLLLESVTAQLDGRPVDVDYETIGSYKVDVDKNGDLAITARTVTGRQSETHATVSAIDDKPPHISDHELTGGEMTISFTDNGGSGIDWSSFQAVNADTGESFQVEDIDEQADCIRFPFPDSSLRFSLSDKAGNPLSVVLELLHKGEDEPNAGEKTDAPDDAEGKAASDS